MTALLIIVRAVYFIAALQLFGLLIFRLVFPVAEFSGRGFRRLAWLLTGLVIVAMAVWLPIEAGAMSGESLWSAIADRTTEMVVTDTRFGHLWLARVILFIALSGILYGRGRATLLVGAVIAGISLGLSAASGHAGATPGTAGEFHLAADMLHLVTVGAWIGGLLPFAWIVTRHVTVRDPPSLIAAYDAARRFSLMGIVCVGTILVTGIVNSWFLVGSLPALMGTDYGQLLLVKIALFTMILIMAAINRLWLTPQVRRGAVPALGRLQRNALIEAMLGLCVIAIVGVLGTLPPAVHDLPVWPFSLRIEWNPVPTLVRAYPTSFVHSPVPYAAPSVARGQAVYVKRCASCHGAGGQGNGPAATDLAVKPADLTKHDLFADLDGELFWWISHGMGAAMPGFDDVLSERQRWDTINFVRALNAGVAARKVLSRVRDAPAPSIPDFTFEIGGQEQTLGQVLHRSAVLLVLFGTSGAKPGLELLAASEPRLRQTGLTLLVVPLGEPGSLAIPTTLRVAPDVAQTLALFADENEAASLYMIDGNSYVRARWPAGPGGAVPDADTLIATVDKMKTLPTAAAEHLY